MQNAREKQYRSARDTALRSLASRPRSVAEVRERLRRKFDDAVVDLVVDQLVDEGLLDDVGFAAAWRSERERARPRSAALVRRELERRGVSSSVARAAVADMDDDESAERLARQRAAALGGLDYQTFTRRLGGYLLRRGYAPALVRRVVRRLAAERASPSREVRGNRDAPWPNDEGPNMGRKRRIPWK